jgi:hypothetical protein
MNQFQLTAEEQAEIDEFCAEHGNNVEAVDGLGRTLLHQAVELGKISVILFLIAEGADVFAKDKFGNMPLDIAKERGDPVIVDFLSDVLTSAPTISPYEMKSFRLYVDQDDWDAIKFIAVKLFIMGIIALTIMLITWWAGK